MLVSDILKTKGDLVHAISRDRSITDAARLLSERKIGSVVVLEAGRLVGSCPSAISSGRSPRGARFAWRSRWRR